MDVKTMIKTIRKEYMSCCRVLDEVEKEYNKNKKSVKNREKYYFAASQLMEVSEISYQLGIDIHSKPVAMYDLRMNDAWNYDWCLVEKQENDNVNHNTFSLAYYDECGDMVFCDGTEAKAREYFKKYCENFGLQLVDYDELEVVSV